MTRLPFVLLALSLNAFASTPVPVVADHKYFDAACKRAKVEPQEILQRKYSFRLDASGAVFARPVDGVHGTPMDKFYSVDTLSFVTFANDHVLPPGAAMVKITSVEVQTGDNGVAAEEAPVFFIKVRGRDAHGHEFSLEKGGSGPAVSNFQFAKNRYPKLLESANIAYQSAFLRVLSAIESVVAGKGNEPNPTPEPASPSQGGSQ